MVAMCPSVIFVFLFVQLQERFVQGPNECQCNYMLQFDFEVSFKIYTTLKCSSDLLPLTFSLRRSVCAFY